MATQSAAPARASRIFNLAVLAAGFITAAATAMTYGGWTLPLSNWPYLLAVPIIVIIARFPLLLDRRGSAIEIGFDFCVLIFLVSTVSTAITLLLWTAGVVLTQLCNDKRTSTKVFNVGLSVFSGAVAVFAIEYLADGQTGTLREVTAIGVGCVAYFLCDFVISAVSVALDERVPVLSQLTQPDAVDAAACFLATASLGYFAALVVRDLARWTVVLLAVPLAILLVAARAVTRGRENARRLGVLFGAAARAQTLRSVSEVLQALKDDARELLRVPAIDVREEPPGAHEVGARFADGYVEQWIVARAGQRARSSVAADQQALEALVAVAVEAFARLRLTAEMTHMAHHDVLTGLPNRALFLDRAEHALLMARRRATRLAVLYFDLDGFKRVNDRFGHAAGDALLVEVAGRIAKALRETDTVARLGGDEFAVLIEDIEGETHVELVCERLLSVLRERIFIAEHYVSVTTSIGVAYSESAQSADGLLRNADMAMYEAKRQGKDRCQKYESALGQARVERLEMVEALRNAVDAGNLGVMYQPVMEVWTGRIVGVEALVRWTLDGQAVPPDIFIGAAEESGLVVALGEVVLDIVTADAPSLRTAAGERISLGVNVSAQQLRSQAFIEKVEAAQAMLGDLELLLEITERDFVANDASSLNMMGRLAARGVRFAVDDFGVGFSSIGYLQQLPVHILKTDRSFTAGIDEDERACKLLRSMVVMGEALGLRVIVEGVERQGQVEHLIKHVGAPMAQGYLLQRPVRLPELLAALGAERGTAPQPVASLAAPLG